MARTPAQTAAQAESYARQGTYFGAGMCLKFARTCAGIAAKYPDASTAWANTKHRGTGTPPVGSFVWWTGGSGGHGHVAISIGSGKCISTDIARAGRADFTYISRITSAWGLNYRGYSWDCNGVNIYVATAVTVRLSNLKPGLRNSDVADLQRALIRKGMSIPDGATGYFGTQTRTAVSVWQRNLGFTGDDANGIPGRVSCERLGLVVL